jgi:hypothetical protein
MSDPIQLEAVREALKDVLRPFAKEAERAKSVDGLGPTPPETVLRPTLTFGELDAARQALATLERAPAGEERGCFTCKAVIGPGDDYRCTDCNYIFCGNCITRHFADSKRPPPAPPPSGLASGWKLLPREPSEQMMRKGFAAGAVKVAGEICSNPKCMIGRITPNSTDAVWLAMWDAAPPGPDEPQREPTPSPNRELIAELCEALERASRALKSWPTRPPIANTIITACDAALSKAREGAAG